MTLSFHTDNVAYVGNVLPGRNTSSLLSTDIPRIPGGSFQDQTQVQAVIQKPVKYIENVFGQDVRRDPRNRNYDVEMSFWPKFGKDRMNTGALPYATAPRLRKKGGDRMTPVNTKIPYNRACFNECLNAAGPNYLRWWQIWDYAPFLPSNGNVAADPKYGMDTKKFTQPYKFGGGKSPLPISPREFL